MNVAEINPLSLPSLPLTERRQLPDCPAIYFVLEGTCVLYIGRAENLQQRWTAHHRYNQVKTNSSVRIAWLECTEPGLLPQIESVLIEQFDPPFNGSPLEGGRPRTTISFDFDEYQELKDWADSEFRSIPQLVLVLVKKALIERKERDRTNDSPTETVPSATKAKRGKGSKEAS